MLKMKYLVIAALIVASGCAAKYPITFDSVPQGATLVCNGTNYGFTPVTLYYDKSVKTHSRINASGCSAVWSTGVSAPYSPFLAIYPQGASDIVQRPGSAGYEQDAEFALKVQQMNSEKQNSQTVQQQNGRTQQTISCRKIGELTG